MRRVCALKDSLFPSFSKVEYERRYHNIRQLMDAHGVVALVIYGDSQMNRARQADLHYVTNFLGNWGNLCVFPRSGDLALFVQSFNHVPDAQRAAIVEHTRHGGANSGETVAKHMQDIGIIRGDVGLVGGIPYDQYLPMTKLLPEVRFHNLTRPYRRLRSDKSDEEVAWMRRGAAFTDMAMYALKEQVRPGLTEYQLAAIIEKAYLNDGGQTGLHYISSTSMHASDRCAPAQNHGDRVIQKGDVILTEITATYWGYGGQVLRPIAVAEDPTPDYQELYDLAEEAYYRVTEAIKPGATVHEISQAGAFIDETDFTICDGLVHGFGISLVPPSFRTPATDIGALDGDFVIQRNMCLVVQPNIITVDYQKGVQLGNLGVVGDQGFESLQAYPVEFSRVG
jgi:Xaa-Pro aminopeptidase